MDSGHSQANRGAECDAQAVETTPETSTSHDNITNTHYSPQDETTSTSLSQAETLQGQGIGGTHASSDSPEASSGSPSSIDPAQAEELYRMGLSNAKFRGCGEHVSSEGRGEGETEGKGESEGGGDDRGTAKHN